MINNNVDISIQLVYFDRQTEAASIDTFPVILSCLAHHRPYPAQDRHAGRHLRHLPVQVGTSAPRSDGSTDAIGSR